jgi:uncharacterized protein YqeY
MNRSLDDTSVKQQVIDKYGQEAGEKLYQVLKVLKSETDANIKKRFEEAVRGELGEKAAAEIDYDVLMQWISIG